MANDFDEARAKAEAFQYFHSTRIHTDKAVERDFIAGARWQHSLMQERLAELERELVQQRMALHKEWQDDCAHVHKVDADENAQLSATRERMRLALELSKNLLLMIKPAMITFEHQKHGDGAKFVLSDCIDIELDRITKALESGERGSVSDSV